MRIETSTPDYGIVADGLIEPSSLRDFINQHHADILGFSGSVSDAAPVELFKSLEWENIQAIQNFQRVAITPDFEHGVLPWQAKPKGNCYTYSTRTAELLELCGYETAIGYTNEHAYVIVRGNVPDMGLVYMINPDSRKLSLGEISQLQGTNQLFPSDAIEKMQQGFKEPIVTSMYTFPLKQRATVINSPNKYARQNETYETPWIDANFPATVIMNLATAKEALFKFAGLNSMLGISVQNVEDHVESVNDMINALRPVNPQMETRQKLNTTLKKFRSQIRLWAHNGVPVEDIEYVVEGFASMMPPTFSREIYRGDIYRMYAEHARLCNSALQNVLSKSVLSYRGAEVHASQGAKEVARQKLGKCLVMANSAGVSLVDVI